MKNGYDHHYHQVIYTYNLSVPKRFTLDVPNQSPPYFRLAHVHSFEACVLVYRKPHILVYMTMLCDCQIGAHCWVLDCSLTHCVTLAPPIIIIALIP